MTAKMMNDFSRGLLDELAGVEKANARLQKRIPAHNHITRDIKEPGQVTNITDAIEAIRFASFEAPKAGSHTEWAGRLTRILEDLLTAQTLDRDLTISRIIEVSLTRTERWHSDQTTPWTGADWATAFGGETGEALNVVKKLRRVECGSPGLGDPPPDELLEELADELADVYLYGVLLADHYDIDLPAAIIAKFNRKSEEQGFPERLP